MRKQRCHHVHLLIHVHLHVYVTRAALLEPVRDVGSRELDDGIHQMILMRSNETMKEILNRFLNYNAHAGSYTWKALFDGDFVPLDMDKTLEENDVPDESEEFERLSIEDGYYYPAVYLYYDDDLTEA